MISSNFNEDFTITESGRVHCIGKVIQKNSIEILNNVCFIDLHPWKNETVGSSITYKKMEEFSTLWGYSRMMVGFLFPEKVNNPVELGGLISGMLNQATDLNLAYLKSMLSNSKEVIYCWGDIVNDSRLQDYLYNPSTGLMVKLAHHINFINKDDFNPAEPTLIQSCLDWNRHTENPLRITMSTRLDTVRSIFNLST